MRLLCQCDKAAQKAADRFGAVPADHVGRNLVADEITKHGGGTATLTRARGDCLPDLPLDRGGVEKRDVLRPRQSYEKVQTGAVCRIEKPHRGHGKDAHRVDPILAHLREVRVDYTALRERSAVSADRERAVGDPFDEMLVLAGKEELATDANWFRRCRRCPW